MQVYYIYITMYLKIHIYEITKIANVDKSTLRIFNSKKMTVKKNLTNKKKFGIFLNGW